MDESPWTEENTAEVSFDELRGRFKASHERQKLIEELEKDQVNRLHKRKAMALADEKKKLEFGVDLKNTPSHNVDNDKEMFDELVKSG